MGVLEVLKLLVTHPDELKSVINRKLWFEPRILEEDEASTRIGQPSMKDCWMYLDLTSRSFAMVIKELEGELCRVICLFYLVLRGLDTVEDDMTLDISLKEEVLCTFHEKLSQDGWTFTQSGPNEKDRELLVHFDCVIKELAVLDEGYRVVITDIAAKMGRGMARFARLAHDSGGVHSVDTLEDFDLYCHYVAGLVGEGLSRLFSSSGMESPEVGRQLILSNSMGLFLQKTNILRDFREDVDDGRMFWPKAIWGKYASQPSDLTLPENRTKALWALSEMTLDALQHATDVLEYLSMLKNQSVFDFCAIPQVMAIATLDACFGNIEVFHRNVKIRRSLTVHLISKTANPRDLAYLFVDFGHRIHSRASADDPSFIKICVAVGQIIQWAELHYPSWVAIGGSVPLYRDDPGAADVADVRVQQQPRTPVKMVANGAAGAPAAAQAAAAPDRADMKLLMIVMGGVVSLIVVSFAVVVLLVYYLNSRQGVSTFETFKMDLPLVSKRLEF